MKEWQLRCMEVGWHGGQRGGGRGVRGPVAAAGRLPAPTSPTAIPPVGGRPQLPPAVLAWHTQEDASLRDLRPSSPRRGREKSESLPVWAGMHFHCAVSVSALRSFVNPVRLPVILKELRTFF